MKRKLLLKEELVGLPKKSQVTVITDGLEGFPKRARAVLVKAHIPVGETWYTRVTSSFPAIEPDNGQLDKVLKELPTFAGIRHRRNPDAQFILVNSQERWVPTIRLAAENVLSPTSAHEVMAIAKEHPDLHEQLDCEHILLTSTKVRIRRPSPEEKRSLHRRESFRSIRDPIPGEEPTWADDNDMVEEEVGWMAYNMPILAPSLVALSVSWSDGVVIPTVSHISHSFGGPNVWYAFRSI